MTVRKKFERLLIKKGMDRHQAIRIMNVAVVEIDDLVEDYQINWDDSESAYPDVIYTVLMNAINPIALKWLNEYKPQAWFKPMFEPSIN